MPDVRIMCSFMRSAPRTQKQHKGELSVEDAAQRLVDSLNLEALHLRVSRY
jgi:hypothetical protein